MITFENYDRKIEKDQQQPSPHTALLLWKMQKRSARIRGLIHIKLRKKFSRSASRMYAGHMWQVRRLQ